MVGFWICLAVLIVVMLALDLLVVGPRSDPARPRAAILWTAATAATAIAFTGVVYLLYRHLPFGFTPPALSPDGDPGARAVGAAVEYLTAWMIEFALSVATVLALVLILRCFRLTGPGRDRVLFWGVLGALAFRAAMIFTGLTVIRQYEWAVYVLGVLLLFTAVKMLLTNEETWRPERNFAVRAVGRLRPVRPCADERRFVTDAGGSRAVTPLFLALVAVGAADLLFAVDSFPAVLAITTDPFLVITANAFAVLGLRSLYAAVDAGLPTLRYLNASLVFVLTFVGVKMLLTHEFPIPTAVALGVISAVLAVGLIASVVNARHRRSAAKTPLDDIGEAAEVVVKNAWKAVILVVGVTVILFGVAISWIPGPGGIPVILLGLAILATEFVWARRLLKRAKAEAMSLLEKAGRIVGYGGKGRAAPQPLSSNPPASDPSPDGITEQNRPESRPQARG